MDELGAVECGDEAKQQKGYNKISKKMQIFKQNTRYQKKTKETKVQWASKSQQMTVRHDVPGLYRLEDLANIRFLYFI